MANQRVYYLHAGAEGRGFVDQFAFDSSLTFVPRSHQRVAGTLDDSLLAAIASKRMATDMGAALSCSWHNARMLVNIGVNGWALLDDFLRSDGGCVARVRVLHTNTDSRSSAYQIVYEAIAKMCSGYGVSLMNVSS